MILKRLSNAAHTTIQLAQRQIHRSSLCHSAMDHPRTIPTVVPQHEEGQRPKKLIFAPGDIAPTPESKTPGSNTPIHTAATTPATSRLIAEALRAETVTPATAMDQEVVSHPARAHQFVSNPPLTISQLHPTNPLYQFHSWFSDPRLSPSSAPETCTLATASLPSGRVSARIVYLKELDERGWVVYSNWGSKEGKGAQVFGDSTAAQHDDDGNVPTPMPTPGEELETNSTPLVTEFQQGNKWAALTFLWAPLERQVRIEGIVEPLRREESEMYWRTRERGSQIGAWASWQSKELWSSDAETLLARRRQSLGPGMDSIVYPNIPSDVNETDIDDGRALLEQRVQAMEKRFADTKEIPLPPFWGGVRLIPESVEFWQGRKSRLHDRFRYVRVKHESGEGDTAGDGKTSPAYKWRIQRLSP